MDTGKLQATALRLVDKFGVTVELLSCVDVLPADPLKPWRNDKLQTAHTVRAAYAVATITGLDGVQREKEVFYVPASGLTFVLDSNLLLKDGNVFWNIRSVKPISVQGVPLLYILEVEK